MSKLKKLGDAVRPYALKANEWWCNTTQFKNLVKRAFNEADVDKSGQLDTAELYVCILRVYEKINTSTTTHIRAPQKAEVLALMKKYDKDNDGHLNFDEFLVCARSIFGIASLHHSVPLNVLAVLLLRIFMLPLASKLVVWGCGYVGGVLAPLSWVPIAAYAICFEYLLRYIWGQVLGH